VASRATRAAAGTCRRSVPSHPALFFFQSNVMDLHGFGRTTTRGYVHKDGHTAEILDSAFDYDLDDDFYHRRFAARFTDDGGGPPRSGC
jgi:hypothetical protein